MMSASQFVRVFNQSIEAYHVLDSIDQDIQNPYLPEQWEHIFFHKNWIDCVQWHCEDEIRKPNIDANEAVELKRRIDDLNQQRTDKVEMIDDLYYSAFSQIQPSPHARINTESPAWAIDRLSILCLKIYHMHVEVHRADAAPTHKVQCSAKLNILQTQLLDLSIAIDSLLKEYANGTCIMKVYRQVKMYNDPTLNPVLYQMNKLSGM